MRDLRSMVPAVFPPDHDEVAASHESSRGTPGCSCKVCCDMRKGMHKILSNRIIPTSSSLETPVTTNFVRAFSRTSRSASPKTKDPVKDLVGRLRSVSVSAA